MRKALRFRGAIDDMCRVGILTASRVPDAELADACTKAFRDVDDELSFTPETLQHEPFVLFRARVTASEVHVRGRDFGDGTGSDQRVPVQL